MTLDYIKHIKPLEDAGKTDAEIATLLAPLTINDIHATATGDTKQEQSVLYILTAKYQVLSMGNDQTWTGSLAALRASDSGVDTAMGVLMPYLQVQNSIIHSSTNAASAMMLHGVTAAVDALAGPDVQADVDAITGGRKFPGIDAAAVSAARTAYTDSEADEARINGLVALQAEIENDYINVAISGTDNAATVRAAIKAGL